MSYDLISEKNFVPNLASMETTVQQGPKDRVPINVDLSFGSERVELAGLSYQVRLRRFFVQVFVDGFRVRNKYANDGVENEVIRSTVDTESENRKSSKLGIGGKLKAALVPGATATVEGQLGVDHRLERTASSSIIYEDFRIAALAGNRWQLHNAGAPMERRYLGRENLCDLELVGSENADAEATIHGAAYIEDIEIEIIKNEQKVVFDDRKKAVLKILIANNDLRKKKSGNAAYYLFCEAHIGDDSEL